MLTVPFNSCTYPCKLTRASFHAHNLKTKCVLDPATLLQQCRCLGNYGVSWFRHPEGIARVASTAQLWFTDPPARAPG